MFQQSLFGGGDYVAKGRVLGEAADGRHFATYFRDDEVQQGFAAVGLSGDLADTPGDYLFVGTQNTNGSKVDYYQRRRPRRLTWTSALTGRRPTGST